jgi:D-alanine---D-serine ligase
MNKLNIAILFGGQSSEYSVSLHSVSSLLRQIHRDRYTITMIGIDPEGRFYVYDGDIDSIEKDQWKEKAVPCAWVHKGVLPLDGSEIIPLDCAFPVLHGKNGEDGTVQGLLEVMNIHCVGCDVTASALSMDKEFMHIICDHAGIPTAKYVCLYEKEENPSFEDIQKQIPLPWFIKPCNAGSSYGVHKVKNQQEFEEACKDAWFYDGRGKLLVEQSINGFEIGCAVMGNDTIQTGSCDEIEIKGLDFFDFEGKYKLTGAAIHCPARVSEETFCQAQNLARRVYRAMNCCGMARVDMFVTDDNRVILNELNTIPGFTDTSRYPSMMKEAGIEFSDLIDALIDLAMEKKVGVC